MSDCLVLQRSGDMAWLTLNRPELKNAISYEMWLEIPDLVDQVERDSALKVLILRGAYGGVFSAGADITEFRELRSTADGARRYNKATEQARTSLAELTKPSIAMVNGLCMGGGCELALACDLRFADTEARFSLTPAKLGLVYGLGATKDLVDLVGPSQAKYILYSGRNVSAERARSIGLADEVLEPDELESYTVDFAIEVAARAQFSVRSTKRIVTLIRNGLSEDCEESWDCGSTHLKLQTFVRGFCPSSRSARRGSTIADYTRCRFSTPENLSLKPVPPGA